MTENESGHASQRCQNSPATPTSATGAAPAAGASSTLSNCKPFVFGGLAACLAEFATFPIDTAKTRLQLQGQAAERRATGTVATVRYRGMLHCLKTILTQEGVPVLYSGIHPALLRQAVYGTFKYGLYFTTKVTETNYLQK